MSDWASRIFRTEAGRAWLYGAGLAAAGLLLAVAPAATRLAQSWRGLATMRATHAVKEDLVARSGELAQRVQKQEADVERLEAKLLTAGDVAGFTRSVAAAARAVGCSVLSIRPGNPRVLSRPDEPGSRQGGKGQKAADGAQFVERPVQIAVQGEYGKVQAFLERLGSEGRFLRLARLSVQPIDEDREQLSCDLVIAGYDLRASEEEGRE